MGLFNKKEKKEKTVIKYTGKVIGTNFSAGTIDLLLDDGTFKLIKVERHSSSRSMDFYKFIEDRRILIKEKGYDYEVKLTGKKYGN